MDLVKARKRAKKKPGKKKKKTTAVKQAAAQVRAEEAALAEEAARAEKATRAEKAALAEKGARAEEATLAEKGAWAEEATRAEEGARVPSPARSARSARSAQPAQPAQPAKPTQTEPAPFPFDLGDDEVFEDFAFGDDLPPEVEKKGPEPDLVLGETDLADHGSAQLPELMSDDEIEDMEQIFGMETAGPGPVEKSRPAATESQPARREPSAHKKMEIKETKPAPVTAGDDWKVSEPAAVQAPARGPTPSAAPIKIEMDWENHEAAWSLDDIATKKNDFFARVTEVMYAQEFGKQVEDEMGERLELLSFRLANETYAVRLTSIRQIIKLTPITVVPRAPDYVLGIVSLRGNVIPVFDLRKKLNLSAAPPSRKNRIVVVAEGNYMVGLIVDEVEQVVRMSESDIEPPPSVLAGAEAEYVDGIGRIGKKMIIMLALEKILVPVITAPG